MHIIPPIEERDLDNGKVLVRAGVVLAFFLEPCVHECSEALTAVFDRFLSLVPAARLRWAVVNATSEQWREVDAKILRRMRDYLAPSGSRQRRFTAFRINDFGDEAPQYGFTLSERVRDPGYPDSRTLVQMTFPLDMVGAESSGTLCGWIDEFATLLQPAYGYCAPGLLASDARQTAAFMKIRPLAQRYPGYDVAVNDLVQLDIGDRVRGARWITLLGPVLTERLGGIEAIREALPADVMIHEVEHVAILRAGLVPEIGDVNRRQAIPMLRAVARVLEPVTLFDEVNLKSYFANFDDDLLRRWERRFLD